MTLPNGKLLLAVVVGYGLLGTAASAQKTARNTATVIANAPIYIAAAVSPVPLRVLEPGTPVNVLEQQGDWVMVQFDDPQWGRRTGWVQRSLLKFNTVGTQPEEPSKAMQAPPNPPVSPTPVAPPSPLTQSSFPEYEFAVGWPFVTTDGSPNSTQGVDFSVVGNLKPWVGVVFDAGLEYYDEQSTGVWSFDEKMATALGGARFALREFRLFVPYVQMLVGYARTDLSYSDGSLATNYFAIQPGGGVDIGRGSLAARVQVDWRRLFYQGGSADQFRLVVGVVIRSRPKLKARGD